MRKQVGDIANKKESRNRLWPQALTYTIGFIDNMNRHWVISHWFNFTQIFKCGFDHYFKSFLWILQIFSLNFTYFFPSSWATIDNCIQPFTLTFRSLSHKTTSNFMVCSNLAKQWHLKWIIGHFISQPLKKIQFVPMLLQFSLQSTKIIQFKRLHITVRIF